MVITQFNKVLLFWLVAFFFLRACFWKECVFLSDSWWGSYSRHKNKEGRCSLKRLHRRCMRQFLFWCFLYYIYNLDIYANFPQLGFWKGNAVFAEGWAQLKARYFSLLWSYFTCRGHHCALENWRREMNIQIPFNTR